MGTEEAIHGWRNMCSRCMLADTGMVKRAGGILCGRSGEGMQARETVGERTYADLRKRRHVTIQLAILDIFVLDCVINVGQIHLSREHLNGGLLTET